MKKEYFAINILTIIFPIIIAILYAAGLNYYSAYLRVFGVPHGIFEEGLNTILFFGGKVIILYSYHFFENAIVISSCIIFILIFSRVIIDKYNLSGYFINNSKKNFPNTEIYLFLFSLCLIFITVVMILFFKIIVFSSDYGEELGKKHKNEFEKILLQEKNNKKFKNPDLFFFKINNSKPEAGYIIAYRDNFFAFYTLRGLFIEKFSNINEIRKLNGSIN